MHAGGRMVIGAGGKREDGNRGGGWSLGLVKVGQRLKVKVIK